MAVCPGDVIAGAYRIEALVGEGAMGSVFAAERLQDGLRVAMKVLHPRHVVQGELLSRFLLEARIASRITSSHAVEVLDVGTLEGDLPYFVMEFLEGVDLQGLVRKDGPLPLESAARYIVQACDAVAEAHRLGVVHRDLKPANLFLTRDVDDQEKVKVIDFGVSKLLRPVGETGDLTATTVVIGTPAYMAPEQMRSSRVDGRADVWSLAVTLFWLLTGRRPFEGDTIVKIYEGILRGCPDVTSFRPDIPVELDQLLHQCLTWDPEARLGSAEALADALSPYAGHVKHSNVVVTQVMTGDLGPADEQTMLVDPASFPHEHEAMATPLLPARRPRWLVGLGALILGGGGYLLGTAQQSSPRAARDPGGTASGSVEVKTPRQIPSAISPPPWEPASEEPPIGPRTTSSTPEPKAAPPSPPTPPAPPRPAPVPREEPTAPLHPPASGRADDVWGMP